MKRLTEFVLVLFCCICPVMSFAENYTASDWLARFRFEPPEANPSGVCEGVIGALPRFEVRPDGAGPALVRVSLPFAPGALPKGLGVAVKQGEALVACDLRALTYYPGTPVSVRRALVTFPYTFASDTPTTFSLSLRESSPANVSTSPEAVDAGWRLAWNEFTVTLSAKQVLVSRNAETWVAELIAPARSSTEQPVVEVVEAGAHYLWVRLLAFDGQWPRIIELQADSLGTVAVQCHLQRLESGDAVAPDFGWRITGAKVPAEVSHSFSEGKPCMLTTMDGTRAIYFPGAAGYRKGSVQAAASGPGENAGITYLRCAAPESVPFQESAWRRAAFAFGPKAGTQRNERLEPLVHFAVEGAAFAPLYRSGCEEVLTPWPVLDHLREYTRKAITQSVCAGDDFGNITTFADGQPNGGAYGMNRLNHCAAMFREFWRSGDLALRDAVLNWCGNMNDLSLWWGATKECGGTRYNNAVAGGEKAHEGDQNYMWRMNNASNFCTKGYDSFFLAYEETGDPRMAAALRAQTAYVRQYVHADQGECRNIGDVSDSMALYRYTGQTVYLDEALRLFRGLRTKLSEGNLFSQGGQPIEKDTPYMEDDAAGYKHPFAKPYIIGYALAGLPELLNERPEEPKLHDVVRAVADFLADAQDPVGGWRYPHPRSSSMIINQGIEHAAQLMRAAAVLEKRGEPIENLLDAIERTLQPRVACFQRTGTILAGLTGWEHNPGALPEGKTVADLYAKPEDRDRVRDYAEGAVSIGGSPPEGIAYFSEVLSFYLAHRPAERLFNLSPEARQVIGRCPEKTPPPVSSTLAPMTFGVRDHLPAFCEAQVRRMAFPLAYEKAGYPFEVWREKARAHLFESLLPAPPRAEFAPQVLAVEDRGGYEARKLSLSISADSRIMAYLLVPKGPGPFPVIIGLHDHGAHFTIGKEKLVRPIGEPAEREQDAQDWVKACYGSRFIGDELARRNYIVFVMDALFWGDRAAVEEDKYREQQALAANMFQLGLSWAGTILWDDLRSVDFVRSLPEAAPDRIGCIGLSMGASRAWHLLAATDAVKAAAAICWMGDTPTLMAEGNNQTKGDSAFAFLHPGLRNYLDYPDVASIACPKPLLMFCGDKDGLFPVPGVEAAWAKMHGVWQAQHAEEHLFTKLWPVPHEFNEAMQEEAFRWLDRWLK